MSFRSIEETTETASGTESTKSKMSQGTPTGDTVDDQPAPSTTARSSLIKDMIDRKTLRLSASPTTTSDTEFTGTEPLEYVLTLPKALRRKWVLLRLSAYKIAVQEFAEEFSSMRMTHKSVADAEQAAILQTQGLTRSIPHEAIILAEIFKENR